jgi:Histidine kinase-like ATPase domain
VTDTDLDCLPCSRGIAPRQLDEATWPLQTQLELGAFPTAVPCARLHARHVLREWRLAYLSELVELIVSELVTNALQATEALRASQDRWRCDARVPLVGVRLSSDGSCVVVEVWDGNHQLPVRQEAALDAEGGRGLLLVQSLSAQWGSYRLTDSGKVVWAVVA